MTHIVPGRKRTDNQQRLVVFLIGARINKWWLLPLALPILARMRTMQRELLADPDSGLLGITSLGFADVQYWRSVEDLERYAGARDRAHQPTAARYYRRLFPNGAVGVWHETYILEPGSYENLYINMPRHGVGRCLELRDAQGPTARLRGRLGASERAA